MKKQIKSLLCGLCAAALALGCGGCSGSAGSEVPAKVTDITVWTYYNGDQLESFNSISSTRPSVPKRASRCPPRVRAASTIWKPA